MVAEHHEQRLVDGVIEVGGAAGFGQPHGDPVGLEEGGDVQGLPAGEGRIECTHIFYDEDPGTSSSRDPRVGLASRLYAEGVPPRTSQSRYAARGERELRFLI